VGPQGSGTKRRRTCSQGVLHLINTSYARPAGTQLGLTGPLPYAAGGRTTQKIISRAHKSKMQNTFRLLLPQLKQGRTAFLGLG